MAFCFFVLMALFLTVLSPTTAPPPPSPPNLQLTNNIINALLGTGDFSTWASIISVLHPVPTNTTATLFIPNDESLSHLPTTPPVSFDPLILPYHIVPNHCLRFENLVNLSLKIRLPTMLPNRSILVTNNSVENFTVDGSLLTHPDLYVSGGVVVHGIGGILDYAVYGEGKVSSLLPPDKSSSEAVMFFPPPAPSTEFLMPPTMSVMDQGRSGVSCLLCLNGTFLIFVFSSVLLMLIW